MLKRQNPEASGNCNQCCNSDEIIELSIVVPLYNESEVLCQFIERLVKVCGGLLASYEVIFVNDGSDDSTEAQITGFIPTDKNLLLGFAEEGDLVFFGGVFFASACFESGESRAFPETE